MKVESTIDTMAVVTPNCAMARRSQISSYKMLQNPEMKKKAKYQYQLEPLLAAAVSPGRSVHAFGERTATAGGRVSVLIGDSVYATQRMLPQVSQTVARCRQMLLAAMVTRVTSPMDNEVVTSASKTSAARCYLPTGNVSHPLLRSM